MNQLNVLYSVYPVIISDGTDWFHVPVAIWVMEPVLNRPSPDFDSQSALSTTIEPSGNVLLHIFNVYAH